MAYDYPRAGASPAGVPGVPNLALEIESVLSLLAASGMPVQRLGPSLVQGYARFYRGLTDMQDGVDKSQIPLLYSLLGSGTGPLKMTKADASYQPTPVGAQRCGNCSSAYRHVVTNDLICSQVEGKIAPGSWCRIWNTDRL